MVLLPGPPLAETEKLHSRFEFAQRRQMGRASSHYHEDSEVSEVRDVCH